MTAERLEEIREAVNLVDHERPDVPGAIVKDLLSVRAISTDVVRELLDEIDKGSVKSFCPRCQLLH